MPAPRWLARLNRVGLNRIMRHLAPVLPGFGVIVHRGRKTGRMYRTPVNVFTTRGGCTVALTYGTESEWLHNVLADGGCVLETRGRRVQLIHPRVVHNPTRPPVPAPIRLILRLGNVSDFLEMDVDPMHGRAGTEARAQRR
jgi:deazaflavin-dependent oxidoreductase (nitroreductase family)